MNESLEKALIELVTCRQYVAQKGVALRLEVLADKLGVAHDALTQHLSELEAGREMKFDPGPLAEIWMRAWLAAAENLDNPNDMILAAKWADHAVEEYKKRFLTPPEVKNEN